MKPADTLPLCLALVPAACGSPPPSNAPVGASPSSAPGAKAPAATAAGEKKLPKIDPPKITPVKVELEGKCDATFPMEKNDAGKIVQCNIAADFPVGPLVCKAGFVPTLHKDQTFRGCNQKAPGTYGALKCKDMVSFTKTGAMETCYLVAPYEGCTKQINWDENGNVTMCLDVTTGSARLARFLG